MQIIVEDGSGTMVARVVNDYTITNGAFTVDDLGFTPASGDRIIVLARSGATPATAAIASAVWEEQQSAHNTAGTMGHSAAIAKYAKGRIWVGFGVGSAGTVVGVNGTRENPCNNLADALTLGTALNMPEFEIADNATTITLSSIFVGKIWANGALLVPNGNIVAGLFFQTNFLSASFGAGSLMVCEQCAFLGTTSGLDATLIECQLQNTIGLDSGSRNIWARCGQGDAALIIDYAGGTNIEVQAVPWAGSATLQNSTSAGNITNFFFQGGGTITVDASCTAGTFTFEGNGTVIDNSTGSAVVVDNTVSKLVEDSNIAATGAVVAGATSTVVPTDIVLAANDRPNDMQVSIIDANGFPVVRNVNDYATTNGEFTVDDLGFTPVTGAAVTVYRRTGVSGGGGTADWTSTEREQIRHRLSMDGTQTVPTTTVGSLADLERATVSEKLVAAAGGSTTEVRTDSTKADGFYNGAQLVVVNAAGVAVREITSYANTNGAFSVGPELPFTPAASDDVFVLARTAAILRSVGSPFDPTGVLP
jgi:hypothetical protein